MLNCRSGYLAGQCAGQNCKELIQSRLDRDKDHDDWADGLKDQKDEVHMGDRNQRDQSQADLRMDREVEEAVEQQRVTE